MNLIDLKIGEAGIIEKINGGKRLKLRLIELGIIEGIEIRILSKNTCFGPVLICIKGTKIALGEDIIKNIKINKGLLKI